MISRHHFEIGAATGLAATGLAAGPLCAAAAALCGLGAILPDIDTAGSWVGRVAALVPPIAHWQSKTTHRTWTHSVWALAVMAIPFFFFGFGSLWLWVWVGYLTHLIADSLSRAGVAWFYPAQQFVRYESGAFVLKNHNFWLYHTGDNVERLLTALWVAACIACVIGGLFVG